MITQIAKNKISSIFKKPLPVKLTLAVTFLCNSRCKTCNIWTIYRNNPQKIQEELKYEDYTQLFNDIGTSLAWIEFTGGEPTLKKDIVEIVTAAYTLTKIKAGAITTNAVAPKHSLKVIRGILSEIPNNKLFNVAISLDGLLEIHDEIRGVKGNFKKAIWLYQQLQDMKNKHPNLGVHFAYTISRYNAGKFGEFYEYLKDKLKLEISISDITITVEHFTPYYGYPENTSKYNYDFKTKTLHDISYVLQAYKNESQPKNLFARTKLKFYSFYLKNIPSFIQYPDKMIISCVAGKYSAYIDPYGNVYPCTQWNVKLGNIKETPFKEIWWSKKAEEVRKLIAQQKCPNCWTPCEAQPSWVMNFGIIRGWW